MTPTLDAGTLDRQAAATAAAQADAITKASQKNTPPGQPSDLANVHAALTPLPEYKSTTDDGSQAMPPQPWRPGLPLSMLDAK